MMNSQIALRPAVELGFVPTHAKFLGALVPDEAGRLVRNDRGDLAVVEAVDRVLECSRVEVTSVQVPVFSGTRSEDWDMMISDLKRRGLGVQLVIMLGEGDPMDPADEAVVIGQLVPPLEAAKRHGIVHVASTSIEAWMAEGAARRDGAAFEAAVEQLVAVHERAFREAGLADSCIEAWHVEFLRPGEFQTFADLGRLWEFVKRANEAVGRPFFKCLVDAAHCGDSGVGIEENQRLVGDIARAGDLGVIHASAKTTRGCLSTDDGWVAALLAEAARHGGLSQVFIEMFHHEDGILAGLRALEPGHGVDTTDGRDYAEMVADGLETVARCLNNHVARGYLPES